MGKVVTSQGLTEFVQSGKVTHVPDHKPGATTEAAPLEVKAEEKPKDLSPPGEKAEEAPKATEKPAETTEEHDEPLTDEEKSLPEKAQKEIQRAKRAVNKKHAEMKAAQAAAEEADRFAETQFNERKLLDQKLSTTEAELAELKKAQQKPVEPELKEPDENDARYKDAAGNFDWKKYAKDLAKFEAATAVKDSEAKRKAEADERAKADAEARVNARVAKAREKHADFDTVMKDFQGKDGDTVPQFVLNYLFESENSGEVAYFLAKNPAESIRISKLSPIRGISELGKLEDSLIKPSTASNAPEASGATATQRGGAPPPITPVSGAGSSTVQKDPSKMSYKELRAYERERERAKRST